MNSAVGMLRVLNNAIPLAARDPACVEEPLRCRADALHIGGMIRPTAFARTKLRDAATVFVHGGACARVRTLIQTVRHTIAISVRGPAHNNGQIIQGEPGAVLRRNKSHLIYAPVVELDPGRRIITDDNSPVI